MNSQEPEIFELLRKIRYDATAIQAKVTDALNMLANMNLPAAKAPTHICPKCTGGFHSERYLAFHMANVHDGPPVPLSEDEAAA